MADTANPIDNNDKPLSEEAQKALDETQVIGDVDADVAERLKAFTSDFTALTERHDLAAFCGVFGPASEDLKEQPAGLVFNGITGGGIVTHALLKVLADIAVQGTRPNVGITTRGKLILEGFSDALAEALASDAVSRLKKRYDSPLEMILAHLGAPEDVLHAAREVTKGFREEDEQGKTPEEATTAPA